MPLTAEEAVAQAAAEGLTLEPSNSAAGTARALCGHTAAGYKGVYVAGPRYEARMTRAGKQVHLGGFATAEEAALAIAREDARTLHEPDP